MPNGTQPNGIKFNGIQPNGTDLKGTRATFLKEQRLLKSPEFAAIKGTRLTVSTKELLLLARVNKYEQARLGLAVSKQHVKRAVQRNTIKRIARESFRIQANTIPNIDIILLVRPPIKQLSKKELRQCIDSLWSQLTKRFTQS